MNNTRTPWGISTTDVATRAFLVDDREVPITKFARKPVSSPFPPHVKRNHLRLHERLRDGHGEGIYRMEHVRDGSFLAMVVPPRRRLRGRKLEPRGANEPSPGGAPERGEKRVAVASPGSAVVPGVSPGSA